MHISTTHHQNNKNQNMVHKQINTIMWCWALLFASLLLSSFQGGSAEQCGRQAGGALCPECLCCSEYGWCGTGDAYCGDGCQSQCDGGSGGGGGGGGSGDDEGPDGDLIPRAIFNEMLKHRNDDCCPAKNFYTYNAFIEVAASYPEFGYTGDNATRQREIAAFLAQTSHETKATRDDGQYSWGYCYIEEINKGDYCEYNPDYPCAASKQYYGRGPMQLSWNYNYGQCGQAIGLDLLNDPDLVASDPLIAFKTAFWFWMTTQSPKPSCHDVITGQWTPSAADEAAGRYPGYGVTTNIINGGLECGQGWNAQVESRIGFYKRYCDLLGIEYGDNLDCYTQRPFNLGLKENVIQLPQETM